MSRRWLIAVSGVAHLAIAGGLFVSGIWRIEPLTEKPRSLANLAVMMPMPAPSGGPVAVKTPTIKPKERPRIVHELHQLVVHPSEAPPDDPGSEIRGTERGSGAPTDEGKCIENCGESNVVSTPVCSNSSVEAGEQCDDGNTVNGDGCSSSCTTEPRPKPAEVFVAPNVLQGLRISGETQIHPSTSTQSVMLRDGATKVRGVVKLCVAADGRVASAALSVRTGYDDYDATILSGVRSWHYRPYTLNGTPVPACSQVTFLYSIK